MFYKGHFELTKYVGENIERQKINSRTRNVYIKKLINEPEAKIQKLPLLRVLILLEMKPFRGEKKTRGEDNWNVRGGTSYSVFFNATSCDLFFRRCPYSIHWSLSTSSSDILLS